VATTSTYWRLLAISQFTVQQRIEREREREGEGGRERDRCAHLHRAASFLKLLLVVQWQSVAHVDDAAAAAAAAAVISRHVTSCDV